MLLSHEGILRSGTNCPEFVPTDIQPRVDVRVDREAVPSPERGAERVREFSSVYGRNVIG